MLDGLGIIGIFAGIKQLIKESTEKEIPAEYWNNKDLMHKDKMNRLLFNIKKDDIIF